MQTSTGPSRAGSRAPGLLALGLSLALATPALAGSLTAFTGFSEFSGCPQCDTHVNFLVYENTDGDWTDDAFFGAAGAITGLDGTTVGTPVDASARFVYLYQVVNTDVFTSAEAEIRDFSIGWYDPSGTSPFTSAGFLDRTVFRDVADTPVQGPDIANGANGDYTLQDPDPAYGSGPTDTPYDGSPSQSGFALGASPFATYAAAANPTFYQTGVFSNALFGVANVDAAQFSWTLPEINLDHTSSVVFLTSNRAPRYWGAETESLGGSGAMGDLPTVVVPEPSALAVLALLGALGAAHRAARR